MDSYLDRLQQELRNALGGASSASLQSGPPGKWTAAQILEHLFLTYKGTNHGLSKCLEQGSSFASPVTLASRIRSFVVCDLGYFPTGRQAPERATPKGMAAADVHQAIFPELEQMDRALTAAEQRFGADTKIFNHPVLGPFSVRQWRKFHFVHGRHHAAQIRYRVAASKL